MIKNPYVIIGLIVAFLGLGFYLVHHGEKVQQGKEAIADIKGVKAHEKIKQKVIALPDADLRGRWCKWVRDDREKCLRTNIPVGE